MEDINLLTLYIASWGWHLTALLFLCFGMSDINSNPPLAIAFIIMFVVAEIVAIFRQSKVRKENDN